MIAAITSLKHNSPVIYSPQNNTNSNANKDLPVQANPVDTFLKSIKADSTQPNFGAKIPKIRIIMDKFKKIGEEITSDSSDQIAAQNAIDDFWDWVVRN